MFTAEESFDLLQDAMSVVCGPKVCVCCVFRKGHIVYFTECALKSGSSVCVCVGMRVYVCVM